MSVLQYYFEIIETTVRTAILASVIYTTVSTAILLSVVHTTARTAMPSSKIYTARGICSISKQYVHMFNMKTMCPYVSCQNHMMCPYVSCQFNSSNSSRQSNRSDSGCMNPTTPTQSSAHPPDSLPQTPASGVGRVRGGAEAGGAVTAKLS